MLRAKSYKKKLKRTKVRIKKSKSYKNQTGGQKGGFCPDHFMKQLNNLMKLVSSPYKPLSYRMPVKLEEEEQITKLSQEKDTFNNNVSRNSTLAPHSRHHLNTIDDIKIKLQEFKYLFKKKEDAVFWLSNSVKDMVMVLTTAATLGGGAKNFPYEPIMDILTLIELADTYTMGRKKKKKKVVEETKKLWESRIEIVMSSQTRRKKKLRINTTNTLDSLPSNGLAHIIST